MPNAVSLETKLFKVRVTRDFRSALVPWEVQGYFEDFEQASTRGGLFDLSHWGVVELEGKDAADYLQRMSTADVRKLEPGLIAHAAFLTGRAHPVAMGQLLRTGPAAFQLVLPTGQAAAAFEHIEQFHFAESFAARDASCAHALFGLWKPEASLAKALGLGAGEPPLRIQRVEWQGIRLETWKDDVRAPLFFVKMERAGAADFLSGLRAFYVELLGQHLFEFYRVEHGIPDVGAEVLSDQIVLESGFDRAVARNKGCYPGQEVVERIFTYGQVNRKLFPVALHGDGTFPAAPFPLEAEGKEAGRVVACYPRPNDPFEAVGLALLHKSFWETHSFVAAPSLSVRRR